MDGRVDPLARRASQARLHDRSLRGELGAQTDPATATKLPTLWETFVVNCWDDRERITPVSADSRIGLLALYGRDVRPTVVYVDGAHDYDTAMRDILLSAFLWPRRRSSVTTSNTPTYAVPRSTPARSFSERCPGTSAASRYSASKKNIQNSRAFDSSVPK